MDCIGAPRAKHGHATLGGGDSPAYASSGPHQRERAQHTETRTRQCPLLFLPGKQEGPERGNAARRGFGPPDRHGVP